MLGEERADAVRRYLNQHGVALNRKLNLADGIHPNPDGVKVIVARMLPLVKKLIQQSGNVR